MNSRHLFFDQTECGEGSCSCVAKAFISATEGEGEEVKDQILRPQPVRAGSNMEYALGNCKLIFDGTGHSSLINSKTDNGGTVSFCKCKNGTSFNFSIFKIYRIDKSTTTHQFEGGFEHLRVGGVDYQGKIYAGSQPAHKLIHVVLFITTGIGHTYIQGVRSGFHLRLAHGN